MKTNKIQLSSLYGKFGKPSPLQVDNEAIKKVMNAKYGKGSCVGGFTYINRNLLIKPKNDIIKG